jgi:hypothetical protein
MIFKPYECDFGITDTTTGQNYEFDHVVSFNTEDPETTNLVRGSNAGNKTGLIFKEGIKDPKTITVTIIGMSADIFSVLKTIYDNQTRVDCYCINRTDGSGKIGKNAVLSQEPKQLTVDDSAESMNVVLAFKSFDVSEVHKN